MTRLRLLVLLAAPLLGWSAAAAFGAADAPAAPEAFAAQVKPFFKEYCVTCHGPDKAKGKVTLHDIDPDLAGGDDLVTWKKVVDQLEFGDMPPNDAPRKPTKEEREQILNRIGDAMAAAGVDVDLASLRYDPRYANRIDHAELFSGKHKGPAYTPSRLWYKREDYASTGTVNGPTMDNLLKFFNVRIAEQVDGVMLPGKLTSTDATFNKERELKARAVKAMPAGPERDAAFAALPKPKDPPMVLSKFNKEYHAFAESTAKDAPAQDECETVLRIAFVDILRRPAADAAELNKYVALLRDRTQKLGRSQGLKMTLLAIHLKPEMYYRLELGLGEKLPDGRRRLSGMETYYALCNAMGVPPAPDSGVKPRLRSEQGRLPALNQALLVAAYENRLSDTESIRELLLPYMKVNDKAGMVDRSSAYYYENTASLIGPRAKIRGFIRAYFGYADAEDNFKDNQPNRPTELIQDADRFVDHVLDGDKDVLKRLLTDNTYLFNNDKNIGFISTSRERFTQHRDHYGVDIKALRAGKLDAHVETIGEDRKAREILFITFQERAGLLTHPVWNFAHSKNNETDPVVRGKWIREKLLAGYVPDVPITVDAKVSEDHTRTLRERFDVVKQEYCWRCHQKMNPLGFPFESYNELGVFRTIDPMSKKPIDPTGYIDGTGEPGVDGPVADAVDLAQKLAKSTRVRQSFVRHAFRYWMGRNETLDDSPTLIAADKAYVDSGGSMNALVFALITSDSFLYRK